MNNDEDFFDVVVVGGAIQDFISYAPRVPNPGESIRGSSFVYGFGGKGANQSVMAARLGARVAMIGKVGSEMFGDTVIKNLINNGVNTDGIGRTKEANTTMAAITVDAHGQNSIVGIPGASSLLTPDDVRLTESKIANSKVLLTQLEVEEHVALEALQIAKKHGVITIFNASPRSHMPIKNDAIYRFMDIICMNESEAKELTNMSLDSQENIDRILTWFLDRGVKTAILTMGEQGCYYTTDSDKNSGHLKTPKVEAVDTTGAGDAFLGTLAYFTACSIKTTLDERIRRASEVASISVQEKGTQTSYPKKEQLPKDWFDNF